FTLTLGLRLRSLNAYRKQGADSTLSPLLVNASSPDGYAVCEGVFGQLKNEMYYGREWSDVTLENFMRHVDTDIRWYNERRIKLSLGAVSPEMYRHQLGITQ
ncbi:MAG: IS3 family transposase, partial [Serratia symbiotica]|nr:IS3 family transposase [Serratia symbiotica]